ncbi:hypothetical protein BDZ85DRAFT_304366 [Elsinoe ampelina]|uniref:Versicolorin reductase n=1 Tax=Elsinoe ampelina TaxID=302913 RepID=A0A6A6G2F5_9PEZI|nr:hypothetical protein BDZ85DRAFT_304366 [Elsinoe ampelina]
MPSTPVLVPTASLHGKVALITGSGRGIGRGTALELARRGCSIIINYARSATSAASTVEEIQQIGQSTGADAFAIQADVSRVTEIKRLFEEGKKHFGKIDIVFSNSGAESFEPTEEITEEQYDYIFGLNTKAQFFVGKYAYEFLEEGGRVVLMSSLAAGNLGVKDHALYNASKLAVQGIVKAFATDFGKRGITVNAVAPGGVKSDMFWENCWRYIPGGSADWPQEKIEGLVAGRTPLGRCAEPEDIARVVAFLVSDDGRWVNGQTITATGGYP